MAVMISYTCGGACLLHAMLSRRLAPQHPSLANPLKQGTKNEV